MQCLILYLLLAGDVGIRIEMNASEGQSRRPVSDRYDLMDVNRVDSFDTCGRYELVERLAALGPIIPMAELILALLFVPLAELIT